MPDVQSPTSPMHSIRLILSCRRGAQRVNKGGRCAGIYGLFVHCFHSTEESASTHKGLATLSQADDVRATREISALWCVNICAMRLR